MIITIITIIALWKIFTKAGEAGWKSLIPIYNVYTRFQIANNKKFAKAVLFTITEALCMIFGSIFVASGDYCSSDRTMILGLLMYLIGIVMAILLIIINFKMYADLAETFGHERSFAWGLLLLAPIFIWILGFGKSTYILTNTLASGNEETPIVEQ